MKKILNTFLSIGFIGPLCCDSVVSCNLMPNKNDIVVIPKIHLSDNSVGVFMGQTNSSLQITNFSELKNVKVSIDNDSIASLKLDDNGFVSVKGLSIGTTNVSFSSDDSEGTTFEINVYDKFQITSNDGNYISFRQGDKRDKSIDIFCNAGDGGRYNFEKMKNVQVVSSDENIVTGYYLSRSKNNSEGVLNLSALKYGSTKLTISADNCYDCVFDINVYLDTEFSFDKSVSDIDIGKEDVVSISGLDQDDLKSLVVESLDSSIASVELKDDKVLISGLKAGTTKIKVYSKDADRHIATNYITVNVSN